MPAAWLAGVLASGEVRGQVRIEFFDPPQLLVTNGVQTFRVNGVNLDASNVQGASLIANLPSGLALHQFLTIQAQTATQLTLQTTLPVGPGDYTVFLHSCSTPLTCAVPLDIGVIHALPPVPTVTGIAAPAPVQNDVDTAVQIAGTNLSAVTSVYLEKDGSLLRCLGVLPASPTQVNCIVPRGAEPGTYRVRAIADDSASYYPTTASQVLLTIQSAASEPIRVTNASTTVAFNFLPTPVTLAGPGLHAIAGLQVHLDNPNDAIAPAAVTVVGSPGPHLVDVIVPASLPAKLYDIQATAPGRPPAASEAKFTVLDANVNNFLGNGTVLGVSADTVIFNGGNWGAVVENAKLRFLYNFQLARPMISDAGGSQSNLGLGYDSGAWEIVGFGATLTSITVNAAIAGVDFNYSLASGGTMKSSWGIEQPGGVALTQRFSFVAAATQNVNYMTLSALALPTEFKHLAAAHSGLAMDANFLAGTLKLWGAGNRGVSFPYHGHYDVPVCFFEDPLGGGVLLDATALRGVVDHAYHHSPAPIPTRTAFWMSASARKSGLQTDAIGPIRYVPTTGDWASAVESIESTMSNPHIPNSFSTMNHVTVLMAMDGAPIYNPISVSDVLAPFNAVQDTRVFGLSDWRVLHAHGPTDTTVDLIPQWTPAPIFQSLAGPLHSTHGFKVFPYMATPGLGINFPQQGYMASVLQSWDIATQTMKDHFWDLNQNGVFEGMLGDYWVISLADSAYRGELLWQARMARAGSFPFDGIYFDFLDGNIPLGDRNPNNGDAQVGFADLCNEFRAVFNTTTNEFLIATENENDVMMMGGAALGATHVVDGIDIAKDPMHGHTTMTNAHPIGSYLMRRNAKAYSTFSVAVPGIRNAGMILSMLSGYAHDTLPVFSMHARAGFRPQSVEASAVRAMTQTVEEGLFRRLYGVALKTDPDPLWSQPDTVGVYSLGTATIPITKSWVVQKLICDMFWWFGGRAPTSAELASFAARTDCNAVGVYATMTEIRDVFRATPGSPVSRSAFRAAVVPVFGLYPIP